MKQYRPLYVLNSLYQTFRVRVKVKVAGLDQTVTVYGTSGGQNPTSAMIPVPADAEQIWLEVLPLDRS